MQRRKFFQRIAQAAAVVALAPQIAFRQKPLLPKVEPQPALVSFWNQTERASTCYSAEYESALKNYIPLIYKRTTNRT